MEKPITRERTVKRKMKIFFAKNLPEGLLLAIPASPFKRSFPDFLFLYHGQTLYIETKNIKGKMTALQNFLATKISKTGACYLLVTIKEDQTLLFKPSGESYDLSESEFIKYLQRYKK